MLKLTELTLSSPPPVPLRSLLPCCEKYRVIKQKADLIANLSCASPFFSLPCRKFTTAPRKFRFYVRGNFENLLSSMDQVFFSATGNMKKINEAHRGYCEYILAHRARFHAVRPMEKIVAEFSEIFGAKFHARTSGCKHSRQLGRFDSRYAPWTTRLG